ncbi:50S ribosomal protein L2 [Neoehrlichia mikurensis]|uniref:Large ribosomal subunit protein uL2 n=1 Tax=Neoehrlichia mikurensis TaxID=89586 RepID=A0A9Q9BXM7_9RICK|nr:50S ribosomal protein L2 [Neoehrlichia mikurensis]QXK91794.1 50S ribosomal protein L2 [Neoehrlichia mikurensis]QXK93007.1 50S ribosomal protein L2 [Neoehrlichia mikurensis]QXK93484.1 50S ribosomal protein L2 [Neoehrlichia mikurensis]UTO55561.1 50S ribosomal protein L2 [Neoehrlichia mikurensis]UTO56482.1 50S ribosomal protein L2 [Neoehrlichia mikurensis]
MGIKILNAVTSSSRGTVLLDKKFLWQGKPEKSLVVRKPSHGGRNARGVITVRHKGGRQKILYRIVDFKRKKIGISAVVERLEYDPNRTAFLAFIIYSDGDKSYIIAPHGLKVGDTVVSGDDSDILLGNCLSLKYIPTGVLVHNVELYPGNGGIIARAAGSYAQIMGKDGPYVLLRLSSGELRKVLATCKATIGVVSNGDNQNVKLGKAGRSRWLGIRPTVRGVAMNPIDHPHGGGEGKTSGGRNPVTPWGVSTKGKKTRKKNKLSNKYIKHSSAKR